MESLDSAADAAAKPNESAGSPSSTPAPAESPSATEAQIPTPYPTPATPPPVTSITLTQPVTIKIPYGQTVLPRGTKLKVVSHDAQNITVEYMNGNYLVPITSTDFH
jgi:hypothetical protein